jgi:hypothetical protein
MKAVPVPVYKGDPDVVQVDPLSQRVHDGIAAGRTAVARDLLKQEIKLVERTLPPSSKPKAAGRRERASLTDAERRFVSPHRHLATGARNSAADLVLLQRAHDALSRLGATCTDGSAGDGNVDPPLSQVYEQDAAN